VVGLKAQIEAKEVKEQELNAKLNTADAHIAKWEQWYEN